METVYSRGSEIICCYESCPLPCLMCALLALGYTKTAFTVNSISMWAGILRDFCVY